MIHSAQNLPCSTFIINLFFFKKKFINQKLQEKGVIDALITLEEGDRRQETGDRRKITWGFAPPSNA
ncbi:MAG: hypothetical protein F6K08_34265 [Okeania sp. SIO1H6]|nr:hypothetical protein [Okeania sp. SIO1H6]